MNYFSPELDSAHNHETLNTSSDPVENPTHGGLQQLATLAEEHFLLRY